MKQIYKNFLRANLIFALAILSSCTDESIDPTQNIPDEETDEVVTDIDGMINGVSFQSKGGSVEIAADTGNDANDTQDLFIQLFDKNDPNDVCDFTFRSTDAVSFRPPAEVGVYDLFADEEAGYYQGVTFHVIGATENYNGYNGFIEIISINDTNVIGKIDATLDGNFWIKGTFAVDFCDN
ncbi:hypothetical protein [Ekhidna sp.]|uniref:hypothetical protein n=1 Tax=Ekhidna sp. TaxID=2608089 RepID=UPI00329746C6